MRWLVAHPGPAFSVADVFNGWVEGLRDAGEQVVTFQLDDRLIYFDNTFLQVGGHRLPADEPVVVGGTFKKAFTTEQAIGLAVDGMAGAIWKTQPQVLLIVSGFYVPPEMLDHARATGTTVVILHTEQPYELDRELELAAHADLNLINDPLHLAQFQAVAPTVYSPHAYRPRLHHPGPPRPDLAGTDFGFAGSGFGSRMWFFRRLRDLGAFEGRKIVLGGSWLPLKDDPENEPDGSGLEPWIRRGGSTDGLWGNAETAALYRSCKAGINLYRREANEGQSAAGVAVGPREVEMAASGLFFLRDPRQEGDDLWPFLPTFSGPEEAAEQLTWALAHDDERQKAAQAAREAIAGRTFANHAKQLLSLLGH
jgi:spore maturation protein CgeB